MAISGGPVDTLVSSQLAAAIDDETKLSHAWLIVGPPGSGRSNIARSFAAALIAGETHPPARIVTQVENGTHPDIHVLATENVIIKRDQVRELVARAHFAPSIGKHRVVIIEDADRMTEQTSNVLLKELEEPVENTIWLLCAPSTADLIPTIRSRVRQIRIQQPQIEWVRDLLVNGDGINPGLAERSARLAQAHVGMARRLATNPEALARRDAVIAGVLNLNSISSAVIMAAKLITIADQDAKSMVAERNAEEIVAAKTTLGIDLTANVSPKLKSQLKQLEDEQKQRATRSLRDGVDRVLVDIAALYRDILLARLAPERQFINAEYSIEIQHLAARRNPKHTILVLDAITRCRARISANVSPLLAIEALLGNMISDSERH